MTMRVRFLALFPLLLLTWALAAPCLRAEDTLVVIAHPDAGIDTMKRSEVVNVFMGRYRKLPSGMQALALDSDVYKAPFYAMLVNKTLAEINAYWARLTFSGHTTPPTQVPADQVIEIVAKTPGAIGYMARGQVDGRVKVVFELAPAGKPRDWP